MEHIKSVKRLYDCPKKQGYITLTWRELEYLNEGCIPKARIKTERYAPPEKCSHWELCGVKPKNSTANWSICAHPDAGKTAPILIG